MKKIITFCFFTFALLFGTQTVLAQSVVEVNKLASEKTLEIRAYVKFNRETQNSVYEAYQNYIQRTYKTTEMVKNGTTPSEKDIEKAQRLLTEKLQSVFTDEEFASYQKYLDIKK